MEGGYRVDQHEGGADGPLGIVLVGDGRAPDRHHGITDELLHGASMELDDLGGGVEVARQQLADRLGVAVLGDGREADEIREQDADEAPLRCRGGSCPRRCSTEGRAAARAESGIGPIRRATRRAARLQRRAAVVAESARRPVLGSARCAGHALSSVEEPSVPDQRKAGIARSPPGRGPAAGCAGRH